MQIQLILALLLATSSACSDAEEASSVQRNTPLVTLPLSSVPASASAGSATRAPSQPTAAPTSASPAEVAEWMRAARSGSLIVQPRGGFPLTAGLALDSQIEISITGTMARAKLRQRFGNPTSSWAEGIYVFPLPDDAAVDRLRILTDGRVIEGQIQEKGRARKTYEAAKNSGRRAGLVEQERANVFTARIANIRPNSEVTVEIEYQQTVQLDAGEFSLRVPTVVSPRFMPGEIEAQAVPSSALHHIEIAIDLVPGFELDRLESPYHEIVTFDDGYTYGVSLADDVVLPDRDFVLQWRPAPGLTPKAAVFSETLGDHSYALLMVTPPTGLGTGQAALPRNVVFVIDTSGSMAGASLSQAKTALALALRRLGPRDRFNVIEFNSVTNPLFSESRDANSTNIVEALGFVTQLTSNGGTEIARAIRLALEEKIDPSRQLRQVVFLTDGGVGNEAQLLEELKLRVGESRIFAIGIGRAPNRFFMRKLARLGRGSFTHIGDPSEVAEKMTTLFRKLESAVLADIEITFSGGSMIEMYPYEIPDLYLGEPVVVAVKLDAPIRGATVSGWAGDLLWRVGIDDRDIEERAGVHAIWARQAIEERMDDRIGSRDETLLFQLRAEIIELALEHHLVSAFTSLVAVDVTPERAADESLEASRMSATLPTTWQADSEFGLEKGATPGGLNILIGALLIAGSIALRRTAT
jgi:Ca-activated chloride channel family protein